MEELDLKELVQLFWSKKILILSVMAIFVVLAIVYTTVIVVPKYQSTTTVLFATDFSNENLVKGAIASSDSTFNAELIITFKELAKSNKILGTVKTNLGIQGNIRGSVNVDSKTNAEMLSITVNNENAEIAQKIANETAKVLMEHVKEYYKLENIYVVDEAQIATVPYNVNMVKNVVVFGCIGAILSVIYVLVLNMIGVKEENHRKN